MNKLQKLLILLTFACFLAVALAVLAGLEANNRVSEAKKAQDLLANELSTSALDSYRKKYVNAAESSINSALSMFEDDLESAPGLINNCHGIMHEVGFMAFELEGFNTAMSRLNSLCNSGYIHGVLEGRLASGKSLEDTEGLCGSISSDPFLTWQCYHGIGHGFMYANQNDYTASLEQCLLLNDGANACANGVYMELLEAEGSIHQSPLGSIGDAKEVCKSAKQDIKGGCYIYLPAFVLNINDRDYIEAFNFCDELTEHESTCYSGVGSQLMKNNIANKDSIDTVCRATLSHHNDCLIGAVSLLINHYGSAQKAGEWCDELTGDSIDICKQRTST